MRLMRAEEITVFSFQGAGKVLDSGRAIPKNQLKAANFLSRNDTEEIRAVKISIAPGTYKR